MSTQQGEGDMIGRWISNNVSVIITASVLLVGGVVGYTRLEKDVETLETTRLERIRFVDSRLSDIQKAVDAIPNIAYRITAQEEALKATNARVDASLTTISARLAEINQAIGSLSTQMAVLTQRIDQGTPQRRTDLASPR